MQVSGWRLLLTRPLVQYACLRTVRRQSTATAAQSRLCTSTLEAFETFIRSRSGHSCFDPGNDNGGVNSSSGSSGFVGTGAGASQGGRHAGGSDSVSTDVSAKFLADGFDAQASGRFLEAIVAFRRAQESHSLVLTALAFNAEGLLLGRMSDKSLGLGQSLQMSDSGTGDPWAAILQFRQIEAGDAVLAPWAGDGADYAAVVISVDADSHQCLVDWDDGSLTHRCVPLASLLTLDGAVCRATARERPTEVCLWLARRALRKALKAWDVQASSGGAHNAFVDITGILCDTALAEARAVLSSQGSWLPFGFELARKHLQRARWIAERAWSPDARALAAICTTRGELLRLCAAAGNRHALLHCVSTGPSSTKEALVEAVFLHEAAANHFRAAAWEKACGDAVWHPRTGCLPREAVHELLWAKALASVAVCYTPQHTKTTRRLSRAPSPTRPASSRPHVRQKLNAGGSNSLWSPPEKLLPATPGLPVAPDMLLGAEPAPAAAARAWRALRLAAGEESIFRSESISSTLWASGPDDSRRLAARIASRLPQGASEKAAAAKLLSEVAVLVLAMGCRLGRATWARSIAAPLAEAAAELSSDKDLPDQIALLGRARVARLAGYRPLDEAWIIRAGSKEMRLKAAEPLMWCLEGLALSETMPKLRPGS